MRYRRLGATGVQVSTYCLGAMMFGRWGTPDHDECVRIVHAALDAGVNFIDTADIYSYGESEEIVGQALEGRRDDVVVATKVHSTMSDRPNERGSSRRWIVAEVEASLRRLRTDRIDLYQVHRPDPATDIEETLGALSDLVHQGKVLAIGSSTFPAERIVEAQWAAQRRQLERFRCEQPPYSILNRAIEGAVLPTCERYDMGVIVWSPLSGGWLSGLASGPDEFDRTSERAKRLPGLYDPALPGNAAKRAALRQLDALALDVGVPLTHLALAFAVAHRAVTSAIIGPRTMVQLEDLLAGAELAVGDDVLDRIDEIVAPGTTLNFADGGFVPPALGDVGLRRRPAGERSAA